MRRLTVKTDAVIEHSEYAVNNTDIIPIVLEDRPLFNMYFEHADLLRSALYCRIRSPRPSIPPEHFFRHKYAGELQNVPRVSLPFR